MLDGGKLTVDPGQGVVDVPIGQVANCGSVCMPGINSSRTEGAAAFAVGESNPIGRKCSGTSGALLGFVSHMSSGEHHSEGNTPASSTASEMFSRYGPSMSEQTFQAAAGALPCGTAFPILVCPR